jgi:hypothetical protein
MCDVDRTTISRKRCEDHTPLAYLAAIDVRGFLCVSLGGSTVQPNDRLGSTRRCACACSEAGVSSQNDDRA